MAAPALLQADFSLGMRRDTSRDRLPAGASWAVVDLIPEHGAPLRKRGGWRYHGGVGANEVQRISSTAPPGTFTLTFAGQTTAAINVLAGPTAIQSALEGLSNIAPGDVVATGDFLDDGPVYVEFTGAYAGVDVALMTTNNGAVVVETVTDRAVSALIFAEFAADPRIVFIDNLGKLYAGPIVSDETQQAPPGSDWDSVGAFEGAWAGFTGTEYALNDFVTRTGALWKCSSTGTRLVPGSGGWTSQTPFVGEWTIADTFSLNDFATYQAKLFKRIVEDGDKDKVTPPNNPTMWAEQTPFRGAWDEATDDTPTYAIGDVVTRLGLAWQALAVNSETTPVEGAVWTQIVPWRGAWITGVGYDLGDYVVTGVTVYQADFAPQTVESFEAEVTRSPVFFHDLVILPDLIGGIRPTKFDGTTTPDLLDASAPAAIYACVHRGRLVLANTTANPNRVYFSDPNDAETWAADNLIDCSAPVTALASLYDRLLVWSDRRLEAITGAIPPGEPDSDMTLRPMFDVGCDDNRSIAVTGDKAIFSNAEGVYQTDGVSLTDLTDLGGYKTRWADLVADWDGVLMPGGVYRGHYLVRVNETLVVCDLVRACFWEFTNFPVSMFAHSTRVRSELYFGLTTEARVARLSPAFTGTNSIDGDETAILPVWESPFYTLGQLGLKSFKDVRVTGVLNGDGATLDLSYVTDPHMTDYAALGEFPPSEYARVAMSNGLGRQLGVGLKLAQDGPSEDTHIHAIEAEVSLAEGSRHS